MSDKRTTLACAVGASLAAITLFYVFAPSYSLGGGYDHHYSENDQFGNAEDNFDSPEEIGISAAERMTRDLRNLLTGSSRDVAKRRTIVGLSNIGNDCFINSVLQALAGLVDLRLYLIHAVHQRERIGWNEYDVIPLSTAIPRGTTPRDAISCQKGPVTRSLKKLLDALNEGPLHRKTISARWFISELEYAFQRGFSRAQQDAQEFFQLLAQRLEDEYTAGERVRVRVRNERLAKRGQKSRQSKVPKSQNSDSQAHAAVEPSTHDHEEKQQDTLRPESELESDSESEKPELYLKDVTFPFHGTIESQIECSICRYRYKPNRSSFVSLTLPVPQRKRNVTLGECFDTLLKTESIEDFRCDNCTLHFLHQQFYQERELSRDEKRKETLGELLSTIRQTLIKDPESIPKELASLIPSTNVPRCQILRHMRITSYPRILVIHLSRSMFGESAFSFGSGSLTSSKNAAKVAFKEELSLGGVLDPKYKYRLVSIVCHKGSHNSGHYESFRRSDLKPPVANKIGQRAWKRPNSSARIHSRRSSDNSARGHRFIDASDPPSDSSNAQPFRPAQLSSETSDASVNTVPTDSATSTSTNNDITDAQPFHNHLAVAGDNSARPKSQIASNALYDGKEEKGDGGTLSSPKPPLSASSKKRSQSKAPNNRWFRVSDEKVRQCKTDDTLSMQREVYLLFYERIEDEM